MGGDFKFKQFTVSQNKSLLKVGTDSMLLGAIIESNQPHLGLDLGAGNGVLSLMLAQKFSEIKIQAIELHQASFEDCQFNFERSKWANRLEAINADYFGYDYIKNYDLIVSNPPFYIETSSEIQQDNQASKHTTKEAFLDLLNLVNRLLSKDGDFWVVLPSSLYEWVHTVVQDLGLYINEIHRIDAKRSKPNSRVVLAISKKMRAARQIHHVIREEDNSYTDSYINLTKYFHFNQLKK